MIIAVTGGTGFFGSHLIKGLLDYGHHVILLKRSTSDLWRIKEFVSEVDMFDIDVTPLSVLYNRHSKINACIHTATDYGHAHNNIHNIFQTNVSLPFRLLSSLHSTGCKVFINTDTFYTFSQVQHDYMHMKTYILTKKHFREIGEKFSSLGNIKFINMKLFHLYGTMDGDKKFTTTP